mmetsp:Transcript_16034/g.40802  ORF Transcript_16034/g.40802 Transcript_16034/m.40802 type:complete len:109 (+) Transcript_16034:1166-1492(+)
MGVYGAWLRRCVRTYGDDDEDEAAAAAADVLQVLVVGIIIIFLTEQEIELEGGLIRIRRIRIRPGGGDADENVTLPEEDEQLKEEEYRKEDITLKPRGEERRGDGRWA